MDISWWKAVGNLTRLAMVGYVRGIGQERVSPKRKVMGKKEERWGASGTYASESEQGGETRQRCAGLLGRLMIAVGSRVTRVE